MFSTHKLHVAHALQHCIFARQMSNNKFLNLLCQFMFIYAQESRRKTFDFQLAACTKKNVVSFKLSRGALKSANTDHSYYIIEH